MMTKMQKEFIINLYKELNIDINKDIEKDLANMTKTRAHKRIQELLKIQNTIRKENK